MISKNKKRVFVGLSGGVDSAVSALLLKKEGYDVVGVFIKTWHPEFLPCNEEKERKDAMRISAHLDIPFLTFDFEKIYKKGVADYMINEYKKGRTPNPDVMCNKEVKFGAFLREAVKMGADYVATGHYAQIKKEQNKNNSFQLIKGVDPLKDQSYFLWTLKQKQLKKVLFPIGALHKTKTRKIAKENLLPVFDKKDSQGICFLGDIDLKKFLSHYIKEKKGNVLNTSGEVIGWHRGVSFYTIGERHGFFITKKGENKDRLYIIKKDFKKNTITVSENKENELKGNSIIDLVNVNLISSNISSEKRYFAQIRYHGDYFSCVVKKNSKGIKLVLDKSVLVARGQSCVVYDGNTCVLGGIVK
ncbi:MAG: tRNA 2-thiouridine(34) synthase MnmA [Candidatus Paceibacterota bacterium]|jgi:tRNA-specific 2-thiouridylase